MDSNNIKFLKPDEFLVECLIRNIDGSPITKLELLKKLVDEEIGNPVLQPFKPHKSASKNPDREIRKCLVKLEEIREWFVGQKDEELDNIRYASVRCRLEHVNRRLDRLSNSTKRYRAKCLSTLKEGQLLQKQINTVDNNISVSDSIKFVEDNIKIIVEDISSSEDDCSDVESISSKQTVCSTPQKDNKTYDYSKLSTDRVNFENQTSSMLGQFANLNLNNLPYNFNQIPQYSDLPFGSNILPNSFQNSNIPYQHFGQPQSLPLFSTQPINSYIPGDANKKQQLLSNWKIEFKGTTDGVSIERFLFRVEHLKRTYQVSDNTVRDQFGVLLKGIASDWYWCYLERNPETSWFQLKAAIIERFQDRRTDDDIRRLIDSRKQKPGESFLEFYNEILVLTLQFRTPISDLDILRILRYNMNIGLQNHLADQEIDSINTLVRRCVALEDMWKRHNFVPEKFCKQQFVNEISKPGAVQPAPVNMNQNFIPNSNSYFSDPNFENQNSNRYLNSNSDQFNNFASPNQIDAFQQNQNSNSKHPNYFLCWNCRDLGQTFINCPKPRRLFCHGCGIDGFSKFNCPNCYHTGNENSRTHPAAMSNPRTDQQHQTLQTTAILRSNPQQNQNSNLQK